MSHHRRWMLRGRISGWEPRPEDFELEVEEARGELEEGEIEFESEFASVDPYQLKLCKQVEEFPSPVPGRVVARVVASRDPARFPVGCHVVVSGKGWVERGRVNPAEENKKDAGNGENSVIRTPDLHGVRSSYMVGPLGRPGFAAYFGLLEILKPKLGDTLVVTSAAGAVGSLVAQVARAQYPDAKLRIVGFCGSDAKARWLVESAGYDRAFNRRFVSPAKALDAAAPDGVDCFFDCVGGQDSSVIISHMNRYGRVAVCGAISTYGEDPGTEDLHRSPTMQFSLAAKEIRVEGFEVFRWRDRFLEATIRLAEWMKDGKVVAAETVVDGFEHAPAALAAAVRGDHLGKTVVKI